MRSLPLLVILLMAGTAGGAYALTPPDGSCVSKGVGLDSECRVNEVNLHFVDWGGQGGDLVLLAGLDDSARIFDELAPLLAAHHHVIALTRRGFGHSSIPASGYDGATLTADLKAFLGAVGVRNTDLVGHSMSGLELMRIATTDPELINKLVFLDAAMDLSGLKGLWNKDPLGNRDPPASALESFPSLVHWTQQLLKSRSPAIEANLRQSFDLGHRGLTFRTPASVDAALVATLLAGAWDYSHIEAPALAIYSDYSHADQIPPDASPALRAAGEAFSRAVYKPWQELEEARFRLEIPCGQTLLLHNTGHYIFIERPQETAAWINSFLASKDPCRWQASG
jgi:pimeloyl-ACP methyl ester carboxylesterase